MGNYWSSQTLQPKVVRKYGWKPDKPDTRDFRRYPTISSLATHESIKKVDLRNFCPPVYDQGQLGSCTANASGAAYQYDMIKQGEADPFEPSRIFIYYNERKANGTVNEDSGAEIRDSVKTIAEQGICPETMWPYDISKFTEEPTSECYETATRHKAVYYCRVIQERAFIRAALMEGFPVVFGFNVYPSFESEEVAKTGIVPMPKSDEKTVGGHAVLLVGYDDDKSCYIVRNSWGPDWGDQGYCYMPYDYIHDTNLCSDFWTVNRVLDQNN